MSATATAGIVFVCVFGGALLGLFLRTVLPTHHVSTESKDVVKLGMGLLATMAALVLSLLIASAKGSYDTQSTEVTQMAANVALLDRALAHYGPEAADARDLLRRFVAGTIDQLWGRSVTNSPAPLPGGAGDTLYDTLQALSPQSEGQRAIRTEALQIVISTGRTRSLLAAQAHSSIPMPFLVIQVFWVTVIFTSFGLFAPSNATVVVALFVCALSVSGAIFLILELDQPFRGFIEVSSAPLRSVSANLGR